MFLAIFRPRRMKTVGLKTAQLPSSAMLKAAQLATIAHPKTRRNPTFQPPPRSGALNKIRLDKPLLTGTKERERTP
jgi:hypothetical protein